MSKELDKITQRFDAAYPHNMLDRDQVRADLGFMLGALAQFKRELAAVTSERNIALQDCRNLDREVVRLKRDLALAGFSLETWISSFYDISSKRNALAAKLAVVTTERDKAMRGRCDQCGSNIINDCPTCGAPQCCPQCCNIDEQQREIAQLKKCLFQAQEAAKTLLSDRDALAAKLASAQKDTERLDWLIENCCVVLKDDEKYLVENWHHGLIGIGSTPQIAIDAARTQQP